MASTAKLLKPPHVWSTEMRAVVENRRFKQWSVDQVRAMKNGTYNWEAHEEKPVS